MSTKQRAGVAALLDGLTISSAAVRVGVHRRTMTRWLQEPAFCEELRAKSRGAIVAARARFELLLDEVSALHLRAARGEELSDCERWACALAERHAAQLGVYLDLEERVSALEAKRP